MYDVQTVQYDQCTTSVPHPFDQVVCSRLQCLARLTIIPCCALRTHACLHGYPTAEMTAPLARACLRHAGWTSCLRSLTSVSQPWRHLHSSSPFSLEPQAAAAAAAEANSSTSTSSSSSSLPAVQSSTAPGRPSQWYPGNPLELPPRARKHLQRRLRHNNPSRPHLSAFAQLDSSTSPPSLHYSFPPPTVRPRKYQLNVPQPHTTFSFRITHSAKEYIQQACEVFEEQALKLNLALDSVVPLPTRTKRWTLLRSPHVDKQSREQIELKRHKRLLTLTANSPHEQQQIVKLLNRTTGMISERVTMTARIPAGELIQTMTFRGEGGRLLDEAGVKAEAARRTVAGWEEEDEWAEPGYEQEDEVELTEEEDNWGEDMELDDDVERVEAGQKK